jgi:nucleoside-diphosphate-sugar epimerase
MNILVTGANSPSGIAALKYFADKGNIYLLARSPLEEIPEISGICYKSFKLDFSQNSEYFLRHLRKLSLPTFDMVIHICAATSRIYSDKKDFYQVNLINSRNLFENISLSYDVKVLNFSSSSVYNKDIDIVTESSELDFNDDYGLSKYLFESFLDKKINALKKLKPKNAPFCLSCRVPVLLVKNVKSNFIAGWRDQLLSGKTVKLFNPDSAFNSCVNIIDIFQLYEYLQIDKNYVSIRCNVGVENSVTIRNLFDLVSAQVGKQGDFEVINTSQPAQIYSCELAKSFGFKFSNIENAIKQLL